MENNDDDEFLKSYRKVAAAEELIETNTLLELYSTLYKKKYKGEPIFPFNKYHLQQIKDFKRATGEKAYYILQHYFTMRDPWFESQAYSVECLIKNLNRINADFSSKNSIHTPSGYMEIDFYCDACWVKFLLKAPMSWDLTTRFIRCPDCEKEDRPLKRVSKEERRNTILKLGAAFPELPI